MSAEKVSAEIALKYGIPSTMDILRAMLEFAYQQGKVEGAQEIQAAMRKDFAKAQQS